MRIKIILLLFLTACTETDNSNPKGSAYFDLTGTFQSQISRLSAKHPIVEKTVTLKGKQETITTRDIDWDRELELFLQADLNKQSYQSAYEVSKKQNEVIHELKTGEKLPVKRLWIVFDNNGSPLRIEADMHAQNYLYESDKKLVAEFENKRLRNYQITGYQQLFVGSRKNYAINGKIKGDY